MANAAEPTTKVNVPDTIEGKIALCQRIAEEAAVSQDLSEMVAQLALMMADEYRAMRSMV